jgi:hypothetical protein
MPSQEPSICFICPNADSSSADASAVIEAKPTISNRIIIFIIIFLFRDEFLYSSHEPTQVTKQSQTAAIGSLMALRQASIQY